ncbi:Flagellar hook-associated protein 2 [Bordetella sputigena]|uniref:flagellar filament capping protein FliD n=1 Tax=Bordetella sputigena TaxID=1416810 RepID=UPI0039F0EF3C
MATSSLPPVTSLGSGSNLDLQGILDSLKDNEKLALVPIQNQQTLVTTQLSAYGTLQQAIETLQTASNALADPKTYNVTTATIVGGSTAFTVKTQAGATPAKYKIQVDQLATAEQLKSGAIGDRTAKIGTGGSITVTLADGTSKTIDVSKDTSLNGIARAINADDKAGVTASILTDGDGKSYLQLTSSATGTKAAVTKITSTNTDIQSAIGYDAAATPTGGMTQQEEATDAKATINGVQIVSGSNTLDKNIDNVTISLTDVTDDPVTVNVATDSSGVVSAVQSFVSAYNTLQTLVTSLTKYDPTTNQGSALTGDSTTRSISSSLASALRVLSSGTDTLRTIQDLGITTSPDDGTLVLNLNTIDSTHLHSLNDSLSKNPKDVGDILTTLGTSMGTAIKGILGSNGLLATRTAGLNETKKSLQDQYDSVSDRIDADIANLRAQFVQLDSFVAQMNNTSSYLTQQFAALSNQK